MAWAACGTQAQSNSGLINGLVEAAIGALSMLMSESTAKKQCEEGHVCLSSHSRHIPCKSSTLIGPLHDLVTWYKINYAGTQIQWHRAITKCHGTEKNVCYIIWGGKNERKTGEFRYSMTITIRPLVA